MAESAKEPEKDAPEGAEAPKGKKRVLTLGGGVLGVVGVAYLAFLMAVPKVGGPPPLEGPFVVELWQEQLSVNLTGGKHYLGLGVQAEYVAYDPAYVAARVADPLYQAMQTDRAIVVASQKTKEEVEGAVGKDVLRQELRDALEPLLFPVHVGETDVPGEAAECGLAPGLSMASATMRGLLHEHRLSVDAPGGTIALDGGEPVPFAGDERDLRVAGPSGDSVFLDVTGLDPAFVGEVPVGVHGRVRAVWFSKLLVQ